MKVLQAVIDRAESDLRAKAEAVLSTALAEQFTTLPSISREQAMSAEHSSSSFDNPQYGSFETIRRPRSATKPRASLPSHSENIQRRRRAEMVANPTTAAARAFLEERFGVEAPQPPKKRETPTKRVKPVCVHFFLMPCQGRVMHSKTSTAANPLPKINRIDPLAPPPLITGKDVEKGIYDLVTRGLIPNHVDMTPAFIQAPAPVLCGQVAIFYLEKFL